ncbi:MAG TPA: hypothetical protein VN875_01145 [Candidatus Binatus sp.]|nr:hypothetical protein [Candidatus Binatus sp.]
MLGRRRRTPAVARHSVTEDWIAALPREKGQVYETTVRQWESSFAMMSVALDGALSLRARGELVCARQQVFVSADLLVRVADALIASCDALSARGRHLANLPLVEPLKTEFFRGETAQNAAHWNELLHHVLFANRSRFFQKLRILTDTVEHVVREFDETAEDLGQGLSIQPADSWKSLDCLHYDFNTCLCESEIILKSFLRGLPSEQLATFAIELGSVPMAKGIRQRLKTRSRIIRASA